jgi:hypothetical protein
MVVSLAAKKLEQDETDDGNAHHDLQEMHGDHFQRIRAQYATRDTAYPHPADFRPTDLLAVQPHKLETAYRTGHAAHEHGIRSGNAHGKDGKPYQHSAKTGSGPDCATKEQTEEHAKHRGHMDSF